MKSATFSFSIAIVLTLVAVSCSPAAPSPTLTLPAPSATLTSTATLEPATAVPTVDTPTPSASATTGPVETPSVQASSSSTASGDSASLVADVTIPDGMIVSPGLVFTKTWRLSNNGSTTWSTAYSLVYNYGNFQGNVSSVSMPATVPPGGTVDISVPFTAPNAAGLYTSFWILKNDAGGFFGIGPDADWPIYVQVNVSPSTTGTEVSTSGTPGSSTNQVTSIALTADQASYTGSCPVTVNLFGSIHSEGSGSFTYALEAGTSTPGFVFSLPAAQTASYSTGGTHTLNITYTLSISSSVSGWVRVTVSSPNATKSNEIDLAISCQA
jgi:hypothetical protein